MNRVILYKGASEYGVLRRFVDELEKGFRNMGFDTAIIDFAANPQSQYVLEQFNKGCNFVVAFNGIWNHLQYGEKSIYDVLQIPYVSLYVDHPCMHIGRLSQNIEKYIATFVDKRHIDFVNNYFNENNFKIKSFLPHAGYEAQNLIFGEDTFARRSDRILFTGTYKGTPTKSWERIENKFLVNLFDDVFNAISGALTIEEAFDFVLVQRGLCFGNDLHKKLRLAAVNMLKDYINAKGRHGIVKRLLEFGFEVDIYGRGNWSELTEDHKKASYMGEIPIEEVVNLLTQYKFCLNDNNNFDYGSHERTFNSMINGCCCITASSRYYEEIFNDTEDLIFYEKENFDSIEKKISRLYENRNEMFKVARSGREKVLKSHTWAHRAQDILDLVGLINL